MGNFNVVCSLSSQGLVQDFVLITCWPFAKTGSSNQYVWLFPWSQLGIHHFSQIRIFCIDSPLLNCSSRIIFL